MHILKRLFGDSEVEDKDDEADTETLHQVTWTEEVTEYIIDVTETFVWSGGAEKKITYTQEYNHPEWDDYSYLNESGDVVSVLRVEEPPAYTCDRHRSGREIQKDVPKSAWVTEVPPGVEKTGRTVEAEVVGIER